MRRLQWTKAQTCTDASNRKFQCTFLKDLAGNVFARARGPLSNFDDGAIRIYEGGVTMKIAKDSTYIDAIMIRQIPGGMPNAQKRAEAYLKDILKMSFTTAPKPVAMKAKAAKAAKAAKKVNVFDPSINRYRNINTGRLVAVKVKSAA